MELKLGAKGQDVKSLQEYLGLNADGDFGSKTDIAVKKWQTEHGLAADGIVGSKTWAAMGLATTDISENKDVTDSGLLINKSYMPWGQYKDGPTKKEFLFLHHTAGRNNPYNTIDQWAKDDRGTIATEFVLGGQSINGNDETYDGVVVQAFPAGGYGSHLGLNGSQYMHDHSVGIEVCNFGYVTEGGYSQFINGKNVWVVKSPGVFYTYVGSPAHPSQLVELKEPFRGYKFWHRYSDKQIDSLKNFILFIANRDNIDVRVGLVAEIKKNGAKGFEYNDDAFYGRIKGMWTHTNTRKDKSDMFPQQELIDMLLDL